ncbi:MAG TPA: SRPBCC family protein [Fimbriimonadaceae bacterium]|nr:SRPBCC family protein [Fimbriimonadaceae bacterium]
MKTIDPNLDLVMTRKTHVPVDLVWKAWTTPELLKQWFTPKPWKTVECEMDLRPGGRFLTVMESPEGEQFPGEGCVLQVVENRLLVWTSALLPDFRPRADFGESFVFTAYIEMEPSDTGGTNYKVTLIHADGDSKKRHDDMGFESGWGSAFDQMVELMSGVS